MGRILVYPEELEAVSGQVTKAMAELQALRDRLRAQVGGLNWETHHRAEVDRLVGQAGEQAGALAHTGESLAGFLKKKAADFVAADAGGGSTSTRLDGRSPGLANAVRSSGLEDAGIAAVTGVAAAAAIPTTSTGWVKGRYGDQFQAGSGDRPDAGVPVADAPPPVDPFTAVVGAPPLVNEGGVVKFSPTFQAWANQFNDQVRANWKGKATDHAGTGADNLVQTYELTPAKLQKIWSVAAENHVDPKLLLAILKQEGTGSFDTNAGNSTVYGDGNGPQPDFDADLQAAMDGPIMGKLRLYPKAVEAGFQGSWVDWVNWYTPIDSNHMRGSAGCYAEDIGWANGVANHVRELDKTLGTSTGDPIVQYSQWMGQNPGIFQAKHIGGDFEIKPGLADPKARPQMAVWASSDTPPYPGARRDGHWWWFPAPEECCWHIERKK